jgi:phosphatidylserine/phosphatidylglycerophosphate/cardiolipin synthase-like enzyme
MNKKSKDYKNLNTITIDGDSEYYTSDPIQDNTIITNEISVYFRNLPNHLINHIKQADAIVGCVAWLTNESILKQLKKVKHGVSIIVQKEDFLRPDGSNKTKTKLQKLYKGLPSFGWHCCNGSVDTGTYSNFLSMHHTDMWHPVRCCGYHNSEKKVYSPKMHNKFMVFGKIIGEIQVDKIEYANPFELERQESGEDIESKTINYIPPKFEPYAVWTGSMNLTDTSEKNLENGIFINDKKIAQAYTNEWCQILAISEPLDWEIEWCSPEMRIGT